MNTDYEAGLAADKVVTQAHNALLSAKKRKDPNLISAAQGYYDDAVKRQKAAWEKVGPDPLLSQLNEAQRLTDIAEGHEDD